MHQQVEAISPKFITGREKTLQRSTGALQALAIFCLTLKPFKVKLSGRDLQSAIGSSQALAIFFIKQQNID